MEIFADPMLVEVLTGIGGLKSLDVVRILRTKGEISDYNLAQVMGLSWNKARGILYRLYDRNVVGFEKRKDEKTEKLMYYWRLNEAKLSHILVERRRQTINILREKLMHETHENLFSCDTGCTRVPFENAFEMEFSCPDCGDRLDMVDNSFVAEEINSYIDHMEEAISSWT
ncbi:MAG: hypothetical protein QF415_09230 [Candidatus Undinarchaeales archaeon]|nr:hypothetical protein [Candidatus Undinarchaeales archaeon]MDP7493014.1 hypothetical protein [Candidatus Undinarchaeales archaeon]